MNNKDRLEKIKETHLERKKKNELYTATFIHVDWLIEQAEKVERYEKALQTIMKDSELSNGIHGKVSYSYPGKVAKKALEEL